MTPTQSLVAIVGITGVAAFAMALAARQTLLVDKLKAGNFLLLDRNKRLSRNLAKEMDTRRKAEAALEQTRHENLGLEVYIKEGHEQFDAIVAHGKEVEAERNQWKSRAERAEGEIAMRDALMNRTAGIIVSPLPAISMC